MLYCDNKISSKKTRALDKVFQKEHLQLNIDWFLESGVMAPADGTWGVAERIVLTENNSALGMIYKAFPYYSEYDGYSIMEHRRADCNFQTAWLFYIASKALGKPHYRKICINILHYLFNRSGLKCAPFNPKKEKIPPGIWNWSTPKWRPLIYLDDNAWNCICCLMLSSDLELSQKFPLRDSGLKIAEIFTDQLDIILSHNEKSLFNETFWSGDPQSPHWGGLVAMSLAYAYAFSEEQKYLDASNKYFDFLERRLKHYTISEQAYMLVSTSAAAGITGFQNFTDAAIKWADLLISQMNGDANLPSQWHETAEGAKFVDLVYTQNWATLGLQNITNITGNDIYREAFYRSLGLILNIQTITGEKHLRGCWQGMYDLNSKAWGGGDKYEGGANSIYTGWTNAPISLVIAMNLIQTSMFDRYLS